MPILITDRAGYWDNYAQGLIDDTPKEAIRNAFGWTQYKGHGPGAELLGDPRSTLELGSGRGMQIEFGDQCLASSWRWSARPRLPQDWWL